MAEPAQSTTTSDEQGAVVGESHGDRSRRLVQRRHAAAGSELEFTGLAQCAQAFAGGEDARVGFDEHQPRRRDSREAPCRCARRDLVDGRARGRQRASDVPQCRLVAQRHLTGAVKQVPTRRSLEVEPAPAGQDRHLHVVRLGVAETEDPSVTLGP